MRKNADLIRVLSAVWLFTAVFFGLGQRAVFAGDENSSDEIADVEIIQGQEDEPIPEDFSGPERFLTEFEVRNIVSMPEFLPPEELLENADVQYFPHEGFSETFSLTQGYVNEILDSDIIHQYYIRDGKGTDLLMSMFPASRSLRTGNKRLQMTKGWMDEFHVSFDLQLAENLPDGAGGSCWVQYSNVLMKRSGSESGMLLFPGRRAYFFSPSETGNVMVYRPIADLAQLDLSNEIHFDFIRLNGLTYVYADGVFLFGYADGISGKVSFEGGAELFENGNRVRCDFDNFMMRYR